MLGNTWTLCIIGSLAKSNQRFNELQRAIEGINPVTLSDRLKKLEQAGILEREEETVDKLSVVYGLSKKGRSILPVINELETFAKAFYKK